MKAYSEKKQMKAYEEFLRDAGGPIGSFIVVAAIIFVLITFVRWAVSDNPQHQEFAAACTLAGGTVESMTGNHFCVKVTVNESILVPNMDAYDTECRKAGGIPKERKYIEGCYMYEIIPELGKRNDYTVGEK